MINEKEIQSCIQGIQERLNDKRVNRYCNASVKEGYIKCLEILSKKICKLEDAEINNLRTVQSRAIAVLAVDFLNGECEKRVLLGVPIKER